MAGYKRQVRQGVWRLEYQLDGEKYSKNVKAKSQSEADRLLALFVSDIENNTYQKSSTLTFAEFAQIYLDKYARQQCRPVTVNGYIQLLNNRILKYLGTYKITKITDFGNVFNV